MLREKGIHVNVHVHVLVHVSTCACICVIAIPFQIVFRLTKGKIINLRNPKFKMADWKNSFWVSCTCTLRHEIHVKQEIRQQSTT